MKKYLRSLLETEDTEYKLEYLRIIQYYKDNPVKHYNINSCRNNKTLYAEYHHICPKWYYVWNNLAIDNSANNIVLLPFVQHITVHVLLAQHFKEINDLTNYYKAVKACWALNINTASIRQDFQISATLMDQLLAIRMDFADACKEAAKTNLVFNGTINAYKDLMTPEQQAQFRKTISNAVKGEKNPRYKWTPELIRPILDFYNTHDFDQTNKKFQLNLKSEACLLQIFKRSSALHNTNYIVLKTIWNKITNEEQKWQVNTPIPNGWTRYSPDLRKTLGENLAKRNKKLHINREQRFHELVPFYKIFIKYEDKQQGYSQCIKAGLKLLPYITSLSSLQNQFVRYVLPKLK